jgi:hypothetical protein
MLSALLAGRALSPEIFWYSFLLESEVNPGAMVLMKGLDALKKKSITSFGVEPTTFRLVS